MISPQTTKFRKMTLHGFSEIQTAARLLADFQRSGRSKVAPAALRRFGSAQPGEVSNPPGPSPSAPLQASASVSLPVESKLPTPASPPPHHPVPLTTALVFSGKTPSAIDASHGSAPTAQFLDQRIREILIGMCKRGGFTGAVIADDSGLPLADFNCPVDVESIAACSGVLSSALEQAGRLLGQRDANDISLDINYVDKVMFRRFRFEATSLYLLIIAPQEVDGRSEIEISIDQIIEEMSRFAPPKNETAPL